MKTPPAFATVALLLGVTAAASDLGQSPAPAAIRSLEACRADLTPEGRRATFSGTAIFEVVSDSRGVVADLKVLKLPESFGRFVQVAEFESCVRRWRFTGAGTSTVAFTAGTTGEMLEAWQISVASGKGTLSLLLPRGEAR